LLSVFSSRFPLPKKSGESVQAVKLNVFHTMNFMLKHCEAIREKVRSGHLEIQGGIYDLSTGKVEFLGRSPQEAKLVKGSGSVAPSLKQKIGGA
jgi:carbonic anhydrase